jgi:cardiolipin synthase A/B
MPMARRQSLSLVCIALLTAALGGGAGCSSLTAEKRIRHPIRTEYSVEDPQFGDSISHLLGAPLVKGNSVVELRNGDEIFPAMLEAIRGAQKTITFENFIWRAGELSTRFVTALCDRAQAGVKVHIIVDALASIDMAEADIKQLTKAGAEVVKYNPPLPFKILRFNHRTHRKIMVVDGKVGFTGGACLADDWLGNAEPGRWRETHFRVEGPVVGQIQGIFMDNWLQMRAEVLHGKDYFPELNSTGPFVAQHFKSGPRDAAENARLAYLLSIAAARKTIRVAHAQFIPDDLLTDALLDAHGRGVKIEIIVAGKIDSFVIKPAGRTRWRKLLEAGITMYEYEPTLYHCKIMIVDDIWLTAGSVNFDDRSFRINDEANLNVLDREFAAKLIRSFEEDKTKSRLLTEHDLKKRNWFSKAFDGFVGLFRSQL